MVVKSAETRARIARAIWAYSLMSQEQLAEIAGLHPDRLKAIVGRTNPKLATLDELTALAGAIGIPERFALDGFDAIPHDGDRIANLESQLRDIKRRLPPPPGELGRYGEANHSTSLDPPPRLHPVAEDEPPDTRE